MGGAPEQSSWCVCVYVGGGGGGGGAVRHSGCLEIVLIVSHQMNIYTFLREEIGLFGSLEWLNSQEREPT